MNFQTLKKNGLGFRLQPHWLLTLGRSLMTWSWFRPAPNKANVISNNLDEPDEQSNSEPTSHDQMTLVLAPAPAVEVPVPQIDVNVEVQRQLRGIQSRVDQSFASFFQRLTHDSWSVLVRNAKDGGANSVLAALVMKKTMDQLQVANSQVKDMLMSTEQVSTVVDQLELISNGINELSDQSKFVSLNASIEAARAGEKGQVFAVIAGELGKLAADIKKMTLRTQEMLQQIEQSVDTNRQLCHDVADLFTGVDGELKQFSKLMMRIEECSSSQTKNFEKFEVEMNSANKTVNTKAS